MEESQNILLSRGFPNPGANQLDNPLALDLNHLLIKRPSSSFIFRISGHSYSDQGIYDGDIVIIDRSLDASPTDLIIAWSDNSFRLLRLRHLGSDVSTWGVVKAVIHNFK
jgi:DNA polymerase V